MLKDRQVEGVPGTDDIAFEEPGTEQFDIAWALITRAQNGPNMDLGITRATVPASGIARARHYYCDQLPIIYDELQAFTNLQNGFDWHLDYDITGEKLWTPSYPSRGVVWPKEQVRFEWGINVVGFKWKRTTRQLTTRYYQGGPQLPDGSRLIKSYEDVDASSKYGVRVRSGFDGAQDSTEDWLLDQAIARVNQYKKPLRTLSLAVYEDPWPVLGKVHVGDWLYVVVQDGYGTDIRGLFRLLSIKWLASGGLDLEFEVSA